MSRILDPSSTVAIIFGAADWTKAGLVNAPSFRRSAAQLHLYLMTAAPQGLGLQPDFILSLFDDPTPASAQLGRIRDFVKSLVQEQDRKGDGSKIRDLLLYYVGHGSCDGGRELHFLVRDSAQGIEEQSSIGASDLANVLRVAAPKQRRILILDCCFSGAAVKAFGAMSSLDDAVAAAAMKDLSPESPSPDRGTVVLCSSPGNRTSVGLPDAEHTLFTGSLLKVLQEGSASRSDLLSFSDLREEVYDRMLADYKGTPPRPALHQPDQQSGDLIDLPAFPNVARISASAVLTREAELKKQRQAQSEAEAKAEQQRLEREAEAQAEQERLKREAEAQSEQERLKREARAKSDKEELKRELLAKHDSQRTRDAVEAKAEKERLTREAEAKAEKERLKREAKAKAKAEQERLKREPKAQAEKERLELGASHAKAKQERLKREADAKAAKESKERDHAGQEERKGDSPQTEGPGCLKILIWVVVVVFVLWVIFSIITI